MAFVKERLGKWITAAIILVIGILCIVAGAKMGGDDWNAASSALDAISTTLGIILIIFGSLVIAIAVIVTLFAKKGFALIALPGGALLAIGISLVVAQYAANLILILLTVIPYLLIVLGAVIFIDAGFNLGFAIKDKNVKPVLVSVIAAAIIAIAAIVVGALCIGDDPVIKMHVQLIVFGIVLCLVACLKILVTFVKVPDVIVVAVKPEENKEEK